MSLTRTAVKELRRARGEINVLLFGAQGQDGPDETSSIQAAIDAASAGDAVLLNRGTYRHTGLTYKAGVEIKGQGSQGTILRNTSTTGDSITLPTDPDWCVIRNLTIDCVSNTSGWGIVSTAGQARNTRIEDVEITDHLKGIKLYAPLSATIARCRLNGRGISEASGIGLQLGVSGAGGNGMTVHDTYVTGWLIGTEIHSKAYVISRHIMETSGTGLKNYGTGVIVSPWTTESAGSCDTDFDCQTPICVLGYGSGSWKISYLNATVRARSVVIPERMDRDAVSAGFVPAGVGDPPGMRIGPLFVRSSVDGGYQTVPNPISPAQLTADTDNWNPADLGSASLIRVSTDASRNLTGLVGAADRVLMLANVGAFDLVLVHDATSTAANRFLCPGSANYVVIPNRTVHLWYDATSSRWRVVS